jgi:uncharacterized protein
MTHAERIADFMRQKRIAVVGVSRDEKSYSRLLMRELLRQNYDALPVNPAAEILDNVRCVARVSDVQPRPNAAFLLLPKAELNAAFQECCSAAVPRLWIPVGIAMGAISKEDYVAAEQAGIQVIRGFCPFMFWHGVPFYHHLHGFFAKMNPRFNQA